MHPSDWLERRVGPRLRAVADQVRGQTVADVGSDHGLLPAYLLRTDRVDRVIVIEKHPGPYRRARAALARVQAEVRQGDGLEPLRAGEVECLTLSGFGARAMVAILAAYPERVPARVVAQPNHSPELLADWAQRSGYRVMGSWLVAEDGRTYPVLTLEAAR